MEIKVTALAKMLSAKQLYLSQYKSAIDYRLKAKGINPQLTLPTS